MPFFAPVFALATKAYAAAAAMAEVNANAHAMQERVQGVARAWWTVWEALKNSESYSNDPDLKRCADPGDQLQIAMGEAARFLVAHRERGAAKRYLLAETVVPGGP